MYDLSPRKKVSDDLTPMRGGLSISPYNPNFDEVFLMSTKTPDASPYVCSISVIFRILIDFGMIITSTCS